MITICQCYTLQLIAMGCTSSGVNELVIALERAQDPYNLSDMVSPLEELLNRKLDNDKNSSGMYELHTAVVLTLLCRQGRNILNGGLCSIPRVTDCNSATVCGVHEGNKMQWALIRVSLQQCEHNNNHC